MSYSQMHVDLLTDEIKQLRSERDALKAELDAISAAIGTTRYMDPPDGGSVTLAEQVERLSRELEASRALIRWLDAHNGQDNIVTVDAPEHADAYYAARGGLGGDGEAE